MGSHKTICLASESRGNLVTASPKHLSTWRDPQSSQITCVGGKREDLFHITELPETGVPLAIICATVPFSGGACTHKGLHCLALNLLFAAFVYMPQGFTSISTAVIRVLKLWHEEENSKSHTHTPKKGRIINRRSWNGMCFPEGIKA